LRALVARRRIAAMTPIATPDQLNTGPEVVIPIMLVAIVIVIIAAFFRRFLMASADVLAELWRTYGPVAATRALDRRPGLPETPWFCTVCASRNGLAARRCYRCDGRREECEAPVPDADTPAGAGAGLSQRTRRTG
jgi:hypothetical protein